MRYVRCIPEPPCGTSGTPLIDYRATASDHNPNPAGVVCASDTLGDRGLDLGWYAERARQAGLRGHPAPKYVIYNRRIASRSRGWTWRTYTGSNPHTSHVHVSVGEGPDGQSTGPYDDESPWGLTEEGEVSWTEELERPDGVMRPAGRLLVWGNWASFQSRDQARENGAMLKALLAQQAGEDVAEAAAAAARDTIRDEFARLGPALVAELGDVPAERVEQALRSVLGSLDEGGA